MADNDRNPALTIVRQVVGVAVVLSITGDIDMSTVPQLQQQVDAVLRDSPAALIIDLTNVDFMASVGFGVLVGTGQDSGHVAYALVASGPTRRMLDLLAIDTVIDVCLTVEEALRRFGLFPTEDE
jgi:anti-anti-sigma factor